MSIKKAKQFYQELTPQQKHFVDNKTINTTLSIKHWIAFLAKAGDFDQYCDKARQNLNVRITILTVALIGSIITAVALGQYLLIGIPFLLVIFLFNSIQTRKHFSKQDINNYLRLYFMPLLEVLRSKAGDNAKLSASLDFRDPLKALQPKKSDYDYAGRKRYVDLFEPKIIIAGVTLTDASYLETVLLDEIYQIRYTNANGKTKYKTKTLHRLFIRLTASKKIYKQKSVQVPAHVEINEEGDSFVLKLKYKEKEQLYGILSPKVFLTELGILYNLLEPLRPIAEEDKINSQGIQGESMPAGSRIPEALIWNDVMFNEYEYDSITRTQDGFLSAGEESRNIFDS